jgi:hypothetical protein
MSQTREQGKRRIAVVFLAVTLLGAPLMAHAQNAPAGTPSGRDRIWGNHPGNPPPGGPGHKGRPGVPEFDPAAAGTIAALLAGGAVLLAGRRRTRP